MKMNEKSTGKVSETQGSGRADKVATPDSSTMNSRTPSPQPDFLDSILRFLSSVRFGIYLLIILVIVSFVGTILPQKPNTEPEKLQQMFAPQNLALLEKLGFLDLFHAPWFKALLTLLGLNIIFASIDRFSHAWRYVRRPARWLSETVIRGQHQKAEIVYPGAPTEAEHVVSKQMKRFFGRPTLTEKEGRKVLFAQSHVFSRLAAYGIHLSLLIIFAGGMIGLQFGYRGRITLNEGESTSKVILFDTGRTVAEAALEPRLQEREMPFSLRFDKAEIVFNNPKEASLLNRDDIQSPGVVKNWYCTMSIFENGVKHRTQVVAVNQPLSFRGYRFFQSGFDFGDGFRELSLLVRSREGSGAVKDALYKLQMGESVSLKGNHLLVTPIRAGVLPQAGFPFAVLQLQGEDGKQPVQVPVFNEDTTQKMKQASDGKKFQSGLPTGVEIYLTDFTPQFATTLQVSRDPGVTVVWAGCLLLMVGLMAAFYFSHQRVWAMLIPSEHGTAVVLGGDTNKNRTAFERKFQHFVESLGGAEAPKAKR